MLKRKLIAEPVLRALSRAVCTVTAGQGEKHAGSASSMPESPYVIAIIADRRLHARRSRCSVSAQGSTPPPTMALLACHARPSRRTESIRPGGGAAGQTQRQSCSVDYRRGTV